MPEAESELVAGYHAEYSGFRIALFLMVEWANMWIMGALAVTLFLGCWQIPGVSVEMIALGKHVGIPADSPAVRIMHCPMGWRFDWLQVGAETINPYMGKKMLDCGNAVEALAKVAVTGEILEHTKGPKIRIHKFKNKTGYHKRQGHRQRLTVLKVTGIK